jgi:peptidase MA superfamily protein
MLERAIVLFLFAPLLPGGAPTAQEPRVPSGAERIDGGRFSFVAFPRDLQLARALLAESMARDTFPGLPRPMARVVISIAPDAERFRKLIGATAPEWGAAIAFPDEHAIVMQGSRANSSAGDPTVTLRHELAHIALHESLGDLPPRWFDEGYATYAAGEWGRDEVLATNLALVLRGPPTLESLDALFTGGASRAQQGYALAHRAVSEMAGLDRERGLTLFFGYWRETRSMDMALRRAYGLTQAEFEMRWRSATRRRYGALALFADVTLAALFLLLLIGPLWVMRRQRDRRRLAVLRAADEAQERRERESALASLLGEVSPPPPAPDGGNSPGSGNHLNDDLIK